MFHVIAPVRAFRVSPAGSAPTVIDSTYTVSCRQWRLQSGNTPCQRFLPCNGLAVLIVSVAGLIVSANAFDAVCGVPAESCACTVKFAVPAVVGVPLIAPVPAFNVSPAGNAPAVSLHA